MSKKILSISLSVILVGFLISGFILMDKNPNSTKSNKVYTGLDTQQPAPYTTDNAILYTDNFDGANDTTSLKARGYKVWYRGTGPQGASATWYQGVDIAGGGPFNSFNGPTTGYVADNYNVVTNTNNIDSWLVFPRISGGTLAGDSLYFYSQGVPAGTFPDSIRVMYSQNDSVPEGTWTELGRFKATTAGAWQLKSFVAPTSSVNGRFAIRYCVVNGGPSGANSDYIGIDAATITRTSVASICSFACTPQTSGTTSLLQAVSTVSNLVGWVGGAAATVRRTTDGGTTWTNGNSTPGVITGDIYNMYATDANNCLCTTSPAATFIYRTTNGGTTWTQVFTQAGGFIDAIVMTSPLIGYAYGDPVSARWSLWRTSNGGASWDSTGMYLPQNGTEAGWNNSMKAIGTNIWFGTSNTRVYHSVNAGLTWTFGATTGDANSYSLHFNSLTEGIVGTGTVVTKTTNGGTTYATVTALGTGNVTGMSGGAVTDYFYTRGNNIYMTTNSGTTWTTPYTGTQALNGIDMQTVTGCPRGWAVGATGTIIKIGNDTLVSVGNNNNQLPETYSLKQNYPNPFNPSTEISFSLPKNGQVELKVFDITGREVATLVNDFRNEGNYKVEFNASAFASGVYFYTLKSGDFVETKKMVLIK